VKVPLNGGVYTARSIIASAQRCLNLYPEKMPKEEGELVEVTDYPTPGLAEAFVPPAMGPARGQYFCGADSLLYYVVGDQLYSLNEGLVGTTLGTLLTTSGPVKMVDNRTYLVIVDGSYGYTWKLDGTEALTQIVDPAFYPASFVDYLDTFVLFADSTGNIFRSTLSNTITPMDPTYFAAKVAAPDNLMGLAVNHREILLIGQKTTELWSNVGASQFPFQSTPGVFFQHGTIAKFSIASDDLTTYFLGQNQNGQCMVMSVAGYKVQRISVHAIEQEIQQYSRVDDAIAFCYQQDGHMFYVLTFPTANVTWVFDATTGLWHERCWIDDDGKENRIRTVTGGAAWGRVYGGDWQNGTLYEISMEIFTDNGQPIKRLRSFPHLSNEGKVTEFLSFMADMETGTDLSDFEAVVTLRWSDDRGVTFGNGIEQSIGELGNYNRWAIWRKLGTARDRIFEISWSVPAKTALNGAFVEVRPGKF
jgi:Phage stabilisation protein